MTNDILSHFDDFSRRTRALPGLWAVAPIGIAGAVLAPKGPQVALFPILVASGFVVLLAIVVRNLGRDLEVRLVRDWNGMPTTHMLRHSEAGNLAVFTRRRKALELLYGATLPTKRQEQVNPASADELYVAATRHLINRVRARKDEFPLVRRELIAYNRARNMLALRPYALVIVGVAAAIDYYAWNSNGTSGAWWLVVAAHAVLLGMWLFFVREYWVRQTADTYAERLFEALDLMATSNPPEAAKDAAT
ncbi:hypothetical protein [Dactylosporangium sp. CS-033363]|uniref:hypothetical protein n=1 Tax=Dactylosporangium sp. CS-033363 TaxID=3239935 RepID=UPI003D90AC32